jgi:hypothetical protein
LRISRPIIAARNEDSSSLNAPLDHDLRRRHRSLRRGGPAIPQRHAHLVKADQLDPADAFAAYFGLISRLGPQREDAELLRVARCRGHRRDA